MFARRNSSVVVAGLTMDRHSFKTAEYCLPMIVAAYLLKSNMSLRCPFRSFAEDIFDKIRSRSLYRLVCRATSSSITARSYSDLPPVVKISHWPFDCVPAVFRISFKIREDDDPPP